MAKRGVSREKSLPPQQELFSREYPKDLNATQAAVRAGYSKKTAHVQGPRLLGNVRIATRIQELLAKRTEKIDLNVEFVLRELYRIANADIARAYDANGNLLPIHEIPEDVRRAMSGIEVERLFAGAGKDREEVGTVTKAKFWDKLRAQELLGKYFKLFVDRIEHSGEVSIADALKKARERAANAGREGTAS